MKKNMRNRVGIVSTSLVMAAILSSSSIAYADGDFHGSNEFRASSSEVGMYYDSTEEGKNTIIAFDGVANFTDPDIRKSGNWDMHDGKNAAVLTVGYSKVNIIGGSVGTTGEYSDAVFVLGETSAKISGTSLVTEGINSSAVVVANGGTADLEKVTVDARGDSYAFLSQYESDDEDEEDGEEESEGDDTKPAEITIEKSKVKASSGKIIYVTSGNLAFRTKSMSLTGDALINSGTTLKLVLNENSEFIGAINPNGYSSATVTLDNKSRIVLTGDSYLSALDNENKDNTNIFSNGYHLYVAGEEVIVNTEKPKDWIYDPETGELLREEDPEEVRDKTILFILLVTVSILFIGALSFTIMTTKKNKRKRQKAIERSAIESSEHNSMKKPWDRA